MKKILKKLVAVALTATMIPVTGITQYPYAKAASAGTVVRLDPSDASPFNNGEFEGWGTSLCWWANRLGYSESLTQQAADAFFSEEGLGLDIARYNLGGGDDPTHNHITRSDSKIPGYAVGFDENGDIIYDWTVDENQRNITIAALEANPDLYVEGFSNSPPYFMTNSGCTSGAVNAGDDNLNPEYYDEFGKFIADATKHFKEEFGIEFKSYSPMNEPDTTYWGANSPKQEGCHFSPGATQSNTIIATRNALDEAGLTDVLVAGMDETDLGKTVKNYAALTEEAKAALGRIDTHTYSGSDRAGAKATAINAGKDLWMSEVDGGWNGFGLAERIILDMNGMQPSAWVLWDIVDSHKDSNFKAPDGSKPEANNSLNVTGSLWGVGMADHDTETLQLANKYYFFGQFTKYINPGDTIIASSNRTLAAYNKKNGDIKIVALNSSSNAADYVFDMSAFAQTGDSARVIRTNNSNEKWAELENVEVVDKKISYTLPAQSLTTFVIENTDGDADSFDKYAIIKGGSDEIKLGASVGLSIVTNMEGDAVWSSSDETVASVDQNGTVTANTSGSVTIYAQIGDFVVSRDFVVPMYTITGTASWGNDSNRPADSADYTMVADGNLATYFDGTTGGWVQYDYAAPFKITSIKLAARSGSGMPERTVGGTVQGSNDGITWTDLYKIEAAIPADTYTTVDASQLTNNDAYRYIRYTNTSDMANIAEFLIEGDISSDVAENEPQITDLAEFTDNFESNSNIFDAVSGVISDGGNVVFASGLGRFGNAFAPVKSTATATLAEAKTLTNNDKFRLKFDMFSGWESGGKENSFAIKDADGNELAAFLITGGGYNLNQIRIGGENVLGAATIAQCRSNPGSGNKVGANGWNASGQPYVNTVGYNKSVEITIDGTGIVKISVTGGMEDTVVEGILNTPITISSIEMTGDYNAAAERTVSYDNFDGDIITYSEKLAAPTQPPAPTEAPEIPANGELINLNFDNGDLTSTSSYGLATGTPAFVTVDDKACVQFNNTNASAIKLTDANGNSLLTGLDEFTISFKVKPTSTSTAWYFFAAPNDAAQTYQQEKYLGAMVSGGVLSAERYNNSGARSEAITGAVKQDEWNDIMIVVGKDTTSVYVNGELTNQKDSSVVISNMLGTNSVAYIGRANWVTGEYATGYLDDFVITKGSVINPLSEIDLGDLTSVTENLTIPETLADGTVITWSSSNADVVAVDGTVTRTDDTQKVTLTAAVTVEGIEFSRTFDVTVSGLAAVIDTFTAYAENSSIIFTSEYTEDVVYDMQVTLVTEKNDPEPTAEPIPTTPVITEFSADENGLSYKYSVPEGFESYDKYFAVYDIDENLKYISVNESTATSVGNFENCTAKLFIWDDMTPVGIPVVYDDAEEPSVGTTDNAVVIGTVMNTANGSFDNLEKGTYKITCSLLDGDVVKKSVTKTINVKDEEEMGAYLFAHFVGTQEDATKEQIYFSVSTDGSAWTTLNSGAPVLTSTVGEKGVRDPYILRGEDGKFFIIATDLSIHNNGNNWGAAQTAGSKSIVVWESEDLVNWSEASLVKVAPDNAGCTWAPEAVYDAEKDAYMVFWASKTASDNYSVQRMYKSYTKDFKTFTEPEIYIDGGNVSNIDTTITSHKGVYYRFTKNESKSSVTMMKSTSLSEGWEDVATYTINGTVGNTVTGYEGPTIYKLNGEDKWCLLLDYYSKSQGYKPFVTDDIATGVFTSAADFTFDNTYRHGTVMPITTAEYDRLVEAYK